MSSYETYIEARRQGKTPLSLAKEMGISTAACYKFENRALKNMAPEDYIKLAPLRRFQTNGGTSRASHSALSERVKLLEARIARTELVEPIAEHLSSVQKGSIAEDLVYYNLRRRGFEVYRPLYSKASTDLAIELKNGLRKIEVKATCAENHTVSVQRSVYQANDRPKQEVYDSNSEIDFFFLVDLNREFIFILPASAVFGKAAFTLTEGSATWEFKDRYDLLV